jgi:membrane protein
LSTPAFLAHGAARSIDGWQRRHPWVAFAVAVARKFVDDRASGLAALIAYYAFFSVFPLLLALTSALAFVLQGDPELQAKIVDSVFDRFPVIGPQIRDSVSALAGSAPALVIGIMLALWAGLGVTLAITRAFDRVWDVPRLRRRHYVASRACGVLLLAAIGVALVVSSVVIGMALAGDLGSQIDDVVAVALSAGVDAVVMALVFLLATSRRTGLAEVLPGVAVCSAGLIALQAVGTAYVQATIHRASTTYGLFAAVIGLLSWLWLLAQLLLISAEINVVRAERLWPRSLGGPLTAADRQVLERAAVMVRTDVRERIAVTFDEP